MKKYLFLLLTVGISMHAIAQNKLAQDKEAIKALAGYYEVTFNYSETFAPENTYKFFPRYESHGSEWVVVAEETPKKIVLQHILYLGKDMVMKHWREDWIFEEPTSLVYEKDNTWKKTTVAAAAVKGTWTQKVYQVDDSPRYEGRGTWTHVDGKHQWESASDSPLPRRESSVRSDYNVLNRLNRVYLTKDGWMFEQDNKKIARSVEGDKLIVQEKGLEEFKKIDPAIFVIAKNWWAGQEGFWKNVRGIWDDVFLQNETIKFKGKVDNKALYEHLFAMAEQSVKESWTAEKSKNEAQAIINTYLEQKAIKTK